jgi:uncharacterized membrane protein (DUF441 family)
MSIAVITEFLQMISAIAVVFNVWQTWHVKENVKIIEKATNSMKDQLVAATAKAATAEGTAAGIVEGHAAGLEQGRSEERK